MDIVDTRSLEEHEFFAICDFLGLLIRLCVYIYFMYQLKEDRIFFWKQRDEMGKMTIVFFALSFTFMFAFRVVQEVRSPYFLELVGLESLVPWFNDNIGLMLALEGILLPGLSYYFQNFVFFVNIYRWKSTLEVARADLKKSTLTVEEAEQEAPRSVKRLKILGIAMAPLNVAFAYLYSYDATYFSIIFVII